MIQSDLLWVSSVHGMFSRGGGLFSCSALLVFVCVKQENCDYVCAQTFTLPSLSARDKCKLTAHEGAKIRRVGFINFRSRSGVFIGDAILWTKRSRWMCQTAVSIWLEVALIYAIMFLLWHFFSTKWSTVCHCAIKKLQGVAMKKTPLQKLQYLWNGARVVSENFIGYWRRNLTQTA